MSANINAKDGAQGWQQKKAEYSNLDVLVQPDEFLLARLPATFAIPPLVLDMLQQAPTTSRPLFCSVTRTEKELSILVAAADTSTHTRQELAAQLTPTDKDSQFGVDGPWRTFRIRGPMEFHLVGVMAEFSKCLAAGNISLFAVSTWDTDYICVKAAQFTEAKDALTADGWKIIDA